MHGAGYKWKKGYILDFNSVKGDSNKMKDLESLQNLKKQILEISHARPLDLRAEITIAIGMINQMIINATDLPWYWRLWYWVKRDKG